VKKNCGPVQSMVEALRIDDWRLKAILIHTLCVPVVLGYMLCSGPKIDPGATARLYGSRGSQLFVEGNLAGAIKEYQKAYVQAARVDLPLLQAQYLFNIGRVWYEAGELDSADQALQAAYREFSYYKDSSNAGVAAGFIALVFCHAGNYDSAFAWYQKGRPKELRKNSETAFWLTIQARISLLKNRIPEASAWLDRAYEGYKKDKSWNGMAQVEYNRAAIAYSQARYEDACLLLASSLELLDKTPERYRRWRALLASATVGFCLQDNESGERFYRRGIDCIPRGVVAAPPLDSIRTCPKKFPGGF
jgi:tetratricopeptide (TPR) repeat protein